MIRLGLPTRQPVDCRTLLHPCMIVIIANWNQLSANCMPGVIDNHAVCGNAEMFTGTTRRPVSSISPRTNWSTIVAKSKIYICVNVVAIICMSQICKNA